MDVILMAKRKTSTSKNNQQQIPLSIKPKRNSLFVTITIIVFLLLLASLISGCASLMLPQQQSGNVAVIPVHGVISPTSSQSLHSQSATGSQSIVDKIERAHRSDEIEAIVLDINSGGGAPVASAEIAQAVKNVDKPTVAWIRDVGASGAYLVASSADTIIAHDFSTTGSIGVTSSYLEFSGLLDEHNITYNRQVAGYYKDMGSPFKEMTPSEKRIYTELLDSVHEEFIRKIASNRNMSVEDVTSLADGRIYLGGEAEKNGLVDVLGSKIEVKELVEKRIGEEATFRYYSGQPSLLDMLPSLSRSMGESIGSSLGDTLVQKKGSSSPQLT